VSPRTSSIITVPPARGHGLGVVDALARDPVCERVAGDRYLLGWQSPSRARTRARRLLSPRPTGAASGRSARQNKTFGLTGVLAPAVGPELHEQQDSSGRARSSSSTCARRRWPRLGDDGRLATASAISRSCLLYLALHQHEEQVLLATEVRVQRARGKPSRVGDLLDRGRRERPLSAERLRAAASSRSRVVCLSSAARHPSARGAGGRCRSSAAGDVSVAGRPLSSLASYYLTRDRYSDSCHYQYQIDANP